MICREVVIHLTRAMGRNNYRQQNYTTTTEEMGTMGRGWEINARIVYHKIMLQEV